MLTGFASGCPTDAHEEMLLGFIPSWEVGNIARVILPIHPAIGCGDQYWVFGADENIQQILWISEGSFQKITVMLDQSRTNHSVFAEPNGTWSDIGSVNIFEPTLIVSASVGKTVNGYFTASSEFIETYGDSGQLTSWVLTGLERYSTLRPDGLRKTEAECDVTLTNLAGVRTVTLLLNGVTLASGSRTGNGSITLTAVDDSGVSGTVSVAYTVDFTTGAYVTKRYAASYTITLTSGTHAQTSAETGAGITSAETGDPVTGD